jgi:3-oxo-5-alpha-steroid 4-dehydrogenase 1
MDESVFYHWLAVAWMALAVVTFVTLFFITAPYGRFSRGGWGPRLGARWGWILMESPSLIAMVVLFAIGDRRSSPVAIIFLALWAVHYVHRSFIYPFRLHGRRPSMAISVILMAVVFNVGNGYLNGRWLFFLGPRLTTSWLYDPRFIVGFILFWVGFALNQHSDKVLLGLRAGGETGYKIPYGGGYRFVSCPNYLGEMLEWAGWAIAAWNLGALAFLVWTVANLAPRAWRTHRWYRQQFPDYPRERKALLPYII